MYRILVSLFLFLGINFSVMADSYTDHLPYFEKFFSLTKVEHFLEFGLGESTEFFLQSAKEVTSVEVCSSKDSSLEWWYQCLERYQHYKHWNPQIFYCKKDMAFANQFVIHHYPQNKDCRSLLSNKYLLEIRELCDQIFFNHSYDMAFVDPGIFLSAEIVNELFHRVDIIVAHDTKEDIYGWRGIHCPQDYITIAFKEGMGTTFWIKKEKEELIEKLRDFQQSINKE